MLATLAIMSCYEKHKNRKPKRIVFLVYQAIASTTCNRSEDITDMVELLMFLKAETFKEPNFAEIRVEAAGSHLLLSVQ